MSAVAVFAVLALLWFAFRAYEENRRIDADIQAARDA